MSADSSKFASTLTPTVPHIQVPPAALTKVEYITSEAKYQRDLIKTVLIVTLSLTPLVSAGYLAAFLLVAPVWPTLLLALALFSFTPVGLLGLWLCGKGKTTEALRLYLAFGLITSGLVTVLLVDSLVLIGFLIAVTLALLALFLEPYPLALRWVAASAVVYVVGLVIRQSVRLPSIELGSIEPIFLYTVPLSLLLVIALLGGSTVRFLPDTLRDSENVKLNAIQSYEQAQQATMVAREANRLKSEFLSMMSHELRTPLNAIIGFTGIMLGGMGGKLDDDAVHMMHRINSNSQHLMRLINNVLDLAKIEAHQFTPVYKSFSPQESINRQRDQMLSLFNPKDIAFEVNFDKDLPDTVEGDEELFQRIAVNLLSNAFKYTEKGKVTLRAGLAEDKSKWFISVTDTGIGIPPHAREYIFDPFRQVDASSSRQYGGTGLGLAIVREVVKELNGHIHVESVLGKGSVFTVELPINPQSQIATAAA